MKEKAAAFTLSFHVAKKEENCSDESGKPSTRVVLKFQRFIFAALEFCNKCALLEVI
jgi:hypothetical protein